VSARYRHLAQVAQQVLADALGLFRVSSPSATALSGGFDGAAQTGEGRLVGSVQRFPDPLYHALVGVNMPLILLWKG
jgi:hypothetical protein